MNDIYMTDKKYELVIGSKTISILYVGRKTLSSSKIDF